MHPSADELTGLFDAVRRWRGPFLHLLACPNCGKVAQAIFDADAGLRPAPTEDQAFNYGPVLQRARSAARVAAKVREVEVEQAAELFAELVASRPEDRPALLLTDERFLCLPLADRLLAEARSRRDGRVELASLAVLHLERWKAPRQEVLDLRAEARCELADALRCTGHLETAERELTAAAADLRTSTDPMTRASFCQTLAWLRFEQARFDEAFALIDRAADLFEDGDDPQRQAGARLVDGAWSLRQAEPHRATACFDEVLTLREAGKDQHGAALHGLAVSLAMDGRAEELPPAVRGRVEDLLLTPRGEA